MGHTRRRHVRTGMTLALALAFVGIAGIASANNEICIQLSTTPPVLYRLVVTQPGHNTASVVGTSSRTSATGVVTGGGALIGGNFELSLRSTDIRDELFGDRGLATTLTHIHLEGPSFTSGAFEAAFVGYFEGAGGHGDGQFTALEDGTATVVPCPPLD